MRPSLKKLFGIVILMIGLSVYALLASRLIEAIFADQIVMQLICYLIAGIVWIFPAYWVLNRTFSHKADQDQPR
ncbi:DUF2842 domain-containing protein [Luteithermobacter gelatinilyticus]|uniref:DUF2842 domain-containing protein n=1 Tax=Luteithermobacter gelatinilyticus TaxID=2582913 RepID=UPI00110641F3|nr:DUF2842 domain-containing protein [Luteithermobacter gelatinilyticus]